MQTTLYILFGIAGIIIGIVMFHTHHFVKVFMLTAIQGLCALIAANSIGSFFSLHLSINLMTLLLSCIGGTPAVIMLLLADTLFKI